MPSPRAYFLSIVAWPPGCERDAAARLLHEEVGFDLPTARLRLGHAPPMVYGHVDHAMGERAVAALVRHGGDGFVFRADELTAGGPDVRLRDLRVREGTLILEPKVGAPIETPIDRLQVLVRGQIMVTQREEPEIRHGRLAALPGAEIAVPVSAGATPLRAVHTIDRVDLHTRGEGRYGSIFSIDARSFLFSLFTAQRAPVARENLTRLTQLLTHLAPDAVVDEYYKLFRPPPAYELVDLDFAPPAERPFAFYSRWAAMMYRHLMV